jgi:type III pantothenate kinase
LTTESDNSWLAVDVGNSRIKVGLFETTHCIRTTSAKIASDSEREDIAGLPRCIDFRSVPLKASVPWDELFDDHAVGSQLNGVIVGSNQRGVDEVVSDWPDWLQKPVVIRSSEFFPIDIQVDEPRRVGLDRLLNAVAADAVRDSDKQAIIVDCGTATTVDLVSSSGSFCGGAILPGFTLCARALNQYTEVLPLISMNELFDLPPSEDCHPVLGSNTQAAIMSGVFWGQIGAVRELINRLNHRQKKSDSDEETLPEVLLTGGGARLLVPYFANAIHCPFLPLQGLVLAAANAPRP